MAPLGSPYRPVLHAVGVDAFYATSPQLVAEVIDESLQMAAASSAKTVALAGIGTGYGRLWINQFAAALEQVATSEYPPLEKVVIGLRKEDDARELAASFRSLHSGGG